MIILPTATPVAAADFGNTNQSQQNQVNQSEHSRKATDTVQLSSEARQMAGTELNPKTSATTAPLPPQQLADIEVAEKVADNEAVEQQRPVNPSSKQPETTKIDLLA